LLASGWIEYDGRIIAYVSKSPRPKITPVAIRDRVVESLYGWIWSGLCGCDETIRELPGGLANR
jgi:hypothetical protein